MSGLSSPAHLGAVVVTVMLCAGLCVAARRRPGRWIVVVSRAMAVLMVGNLVVWELVTLRNGNWSVTNSLLFDLCDITGVFGAAALWTRRPLFVELTYFWGCAGSLQGLLTPDLRWHFPSYYFFQFYILHSGDVLIALFLVVGLRLRPRPHAIPRIFGLTLVLFALAAVLDVITGGNYMFLRDPGPKGTLLDVMGPWPLYIVTGAGLALIFVTILDAPFWPARSRGRRISARPQPEEWRPG